MLSTEIIAKDRIKELLLIYTLSYANWKHIARECSLLMELTVGRHRWN